MLLDLVRSDDENKKVKAKYTLGKVYFMMNRYQEAADLNTEVIALTSKDSSPKMHTYKCKAMANLATVKCMASNFKECLKLCNDVDLESLSEID